MDVDGASGDGAVKEKRRRVDLLRDDDGDDEGAADGDDGEEYEPEKKIRKKSFVDVVRSGTDQGRPEDQRALDVHAQVRAKADELREQQAARAKAEAAARARVRGEARARGGGSARTGGGVRCSSSR